MKKIIFLIVLLLVVSCTPAAEQPEIPVNVTEPVPEELEIVEPTCEPPKSFVGKRCCILAENATTFCQDEKEEYDQKYAAAKAEQTWTSSDRMFIKGPFAFRGTPGFYVLENVSEGGHVIDYRLSRADAEIKIVYTTEQSDMTAKEAIQTFITYEKIANPSGLSETPFETNTGLVGTEYDFSTETKRFLITFFAPNGDALIIWYWPGVNETTVENLLLPTLKTIQLGDAEIEPFTEAPKELSVTEKYLDTFYRNYFGSVEFDHPDYGRVRIRDNGHNRTLTPRKYQFYGDIPASQPQEHDWYADVKTNVIVGADNFRKLELNVEKRLQDNTYIPLSLVWRDATSGPFSGCFVEYRVPYREHCEEYNHSGIIILNNLTFESDILSPQDWYLKYAGKKPYQLEEGTKREGRLTYPLEIASFKNNDGTVTKMTVGIDYGKLYELEILKNGISQAFYEFEKTYP